VTILFTINVFIPNEFTNPKWYELLAYVDAQNNSELQPFQAVVEEFCMKPLLSPFRDPRAIAFGCNYLELPGLFVKDMGLPGADRISQNMLKEVGSIEADKVFEYLHKGGKINDISPISKLQLLYKEAHEADTIFHLIAIPILLIA